MVTRETLFIETVPSNPLGLTLWGNVGLYGGFLGLVVLFGAPDGRPIWEGVVFVTVIYLLMEGMYLLGSFLPMPMFRVVADLGQVQVKMERGGEALSCPTKDVWWRFVRPTVTELRKGAGPRVIHLEIPVKTPVFFIRRYKLRCGLNPEAFSLLKDILEEAERISLRAPKAA